MSDSSTRRRAEVLQMGELAGHLTERPDGAWAFTYVATYAGAPISLTMPLRPDPYGFDSFPPALEGLLPEGHQLESLLRTHKIDRHDTFRQLVTVGADLVGSLAIRQVTPNQQEGN